MPTVIMLLVMVVDLVHAAFSKKQQTRQDQLKALQKVMKS